MNPLNDKIIEKRIFKAYSIFVFENKEDVTDWLAQDLIDSGLNAQGVKITCALSGGRTPKKLYEQMVEKDPKGQALKAYNWYFGDERCVHPEDDESNYKLASLNLFKKVGISMASIFRFWGEDEPVKEAKRYHQLIESSLPINNGFPVFDKMLLGLGEDGHTASIFPNQKELMMSENFAEAAYNPYSMQNRLTLTGEVINNSNEIFFMVTGAGKARVLADIIHKEGDFKNYPANYIHARHGMLTWLVDKEAAQFLRV